MDYVFPELEYDYVSKKVNLTWKDILYAIKRKLLSENAAIKHAMNKISQDEEYDQLLFDLASLFNSESVQPYLNELANLESNISEETITQKWVYLILQWLYDNKEKYIDPLEVIEQIYAEFNYPKEIVSLVRYMPSDDPLLKTTKLNEMQLYRKWEDYLQSQSEKFSKISRL